MSLRIKICGMTRAENVKSLVKMKPDYMGFIFYSRSLRYVGEHPDPEMFKAVGGKTQRVAVFVNEYPEKMIEIAVKYNIGMLQLHGMESPELCRSLKYQGLSVIKVIPGDQVENLALIESYSDTADFLLFDTPTKHHGGSGRKFDWDKLKHLNAPCPFFLSGGIGPGDAESLNEVKNSSLYAVDINSRFEDEPGLKNPDAVATFINELRQKR